jgi:hypothetical protein
MKNCAEEGELFHADRRTDMTKLIVAVRNFANSPKNYEAFFFLTAPFGASYYTCSVICM